MEATPSSRRPFIALGCSLSLGIAQNSIGLTAYMVNGNWRVLQFISGALCLLYIPHFWFLEESVRWLLQGYEISKVKDILNKADAINGKILTEEMNDASCISLVVEVERQSVLTLFKTPVIRQRIIIISLCWFAVGLAYYGISLNSNFFAKNPYIIFMFTAAVELPAALLNWWLLQHYPRRLTQSISLALSGAVLLIGGISGIDWLRICSVVLSKFFAKLSIGTVYIYTAELFPTPVRSAAVGIGQVFSLIGAIIVPFIMLLDYAWYLAPIAIMGVPCIISGLLIRLYLPDTKNKPSPDTVEEIEHPYKEFKSSKCDEEDLYLMKDVKQEYNN
uniref:Solute carrier family 22 member 6-B-like n=1 Tax=Saccoglossus kowalevskii TaxID=10224 RepID=A0ABM0MZW1_SACKO|nr:PREDICTED: solute carrier family 22 member 6-B-like [Saccoglossus kowalevskii]